MFFHKYKYIIFLNFIIILTGCNSTQKLAKNQNISYLYNPGSSIMHPQVKIFHNNDSITVLFFKINKNEIKFIHSDENNIYTGKLKIHYVLFNSFEKSQVIDSSSFIFNIETIEINNYFISQISIKTPLKTNYSLYLIINDLQAKIWYQTFFNIEKSSVFSSQNFLVTSKKDNDLFYDNFITNKDTFQIICNRMKLNKLYVKYFKNRFPMPLQPYSIINPKSIPFKPDSTWVINISDSTFFNFIKKGIYHFQSDSINQDGLTLYFFNNNFPSVNTPENLLNPLQYLSTSKEWDEYELFANKKEAVDNFWLKVSGNTDRAKELIRVYYNRVILANRYFSSYVEGWKTDRGMIYIILGLPSIIYKSDGWERWIYGKNENMGEMVFDFSKAENPLTNNDYNLQHSEKYKNIWYLAVETWRDGRIYSVAN